MADVKVAVSQDNAVLLLDAAEKSELPPDVVRYSPFDGHFTVDEALAKKAGVDYEALDEDGDEEVEVDVHEVDMADMESDADEQASKSRPAKRASRSRTAKE